MSTGLGSYWDAAYFCTCTPGPLVSHLRKLYQFIIFVFMFILVHLYCTLIISQSHLNHILIAPQSHIDCTAILSQSHLNHTLIAFDIGHLTWDALRRMFNVGCLTSDVWRGTLDTGHSTCGAQRVPLEVRPSTQDARCGTLNAGR